MDGTDPLDDAVRLLVAGDERAFHLVYRSIQPGLLRYLTLLVGASEAEDVASETWGQAFRDLRRFTGDGAGFRAWIATIGRHRALDHVRARDRRPVTDRSAELPDRAAGPDALDAALENISTAAALALIATLPPDQAEAVLLRTVMGLDAKSAGQVLGKRSGAVRTAAFRGLRTLAKGLADSVTDGQPIVE